MVVHRLLRKVKGKTYPVAFARKVDMLIDSVGRHCSETERKAERAERDAVKMKQLQYMEKSPLHQCMFWVYPIVEATDSPACPV